MSLCSGGSGADIGCLDDVCVGGGWSPGNKVKKAAVSDAVAHDEDWISIAVHTVNLDSWNGDPAVLGVEGSFMHHLDVGNVQELVSSGEEDSSVHEEDIIDPAMGKWGVDVTAWLAETRAAEMEKIAAAAAKARAAHSESESSSDAAEEPASETELDECCNEQAAEQGSDVATSDVAEEPASETEPEEWQTDLLSLLDEPLLKPPYTPYTAGVEAAGVAAARVEATGIAAAGVEAAGVEAAGIAATPPPKVRGDGLEQTPPAPTIAPLARMWGAPSTDSTTEDFEARWRMTTKRRRTLHGSWTEAGMYM